jgi:glutamate carboxypeptidase
MDAWVDHFAAEIAARAPRELEALVGVSSPSGDVRGAEEAAAVIAALLPDEATVERIPCSSPEHAPDLLARVRGTGSRRLLLLGHLDTVVAHGEHQPLRRDDGRLIGSGSVDMKGGDVLALGVLRTLAREPERYAEVALLLVCDEEWRTEDFAHVPRFAGYDACLCFEAGELTPEGEDAVVVRRKAAGTLRVDAEGRSAHSGSAPHKGVNALLALAEAATRVAACNDPAGPDRLTAVPTVARAGEALNVVPARGHLVCDLRADTLDAFARVVDAVGNGDGRGALLRTAMLRRWPGMDAREATSTLLAGAGGRLGRPLVGVDRGGASDASHFAATIPLTVDGLGPRGGGAHAPHEYVLEASLRTRAEVALALVAEALAG